MAKNLTHSMSPVTIGIKIEPSSPARNSTANNPNNGAFRDDNGVPTVASGHVVRLGPVFGVVEVDHQDKLAGADGSPVINFGLNVWRVKARVATAVTTTTSTHYLRGSVVQFADGAGFAEGGRVYIGTPKLALTSVGAGVSAHRNCGVLMEDITDVLSADAEIEVDVLIGLVFDVLGTVIS